MKSRISSLVAGLALVGVVGIAQAAPTTFFGENQSPGGAVGGDPAIARADFLGHLTGVGSEGFEGFDVGRTASTPLSLSFTSSGATPLAATLSGTGQVENRTVDDQDNPTGRFNTTSGGSKWWDVSGEFTIDFGTPISAFGFYGTDIGDFAGQVTVNLRNAADHGTVVALTVPNTVGAANGSLLFWGFVDLTTSYDQITFGNTETSVDGFGFDDMVIGDRGQVDQPNPAPEPTTLALVALGLLGLAARRRRA